MLPQTGLSGDKTVSHCGRTSQNCAAYFKIAIRRYSPFYLHHYLHYLHVLECKRIYTSVHVCIYLCLYAHMKVYPLCIKK